MRALQRSISHHRLAASILIVTLLIVLFVFLVDWPGVFKQLRRIDDIDLIFASGALLVGLAAYAIRWRSLFTRLPRRRSAFNAANAGHMINLLIPLRPGDAGRIVILGKKDSIALSQATSSVVVERWFEQIMRIAALGGAIVLGAGMQVSASTLWVALVFLTLSLAAMIWLVGRRQWVLDRWPAALARLPRLSEARVRRVLSGLLDGLASVASFRRLLLAFIWSLVTWGFFWTFHLLVLYALKAGLSPGEMLAVSLGSLSLAPPSAPTQPGVYHASLIIPLQLVGFDAVMLTSYALVLHALQMVWMVGLGLWGLSQSGFSFRQLLGQVETNPD